MIVDLPGHRVLPMQSTDYDDLSAKADMALYRSGQTGRNQVTMWYKELELP